MEVEDNASIIVNSTIMPGLSLSILNNLLTKIQNGCVQRIFSMLAKNPNTYVENLQVRITLESSDLAVLADGGTGIFIRFFLEVDLGDNNMIKTTYACRAKDLYTYVVQFMYLLHSKSIITGVPISSSTWESAGSDIKAMQKQKFVLHVRNDLPYGKLLSRANIEMDEVGGNEGHSFRTTIMYAMTELGLQDLALFNNFRSKYETLERLFIHHTLVNATKNQVKDLPTFILFMKHVAHQGLFKNLEEHSKTNYKELIWLEAQYMRLRCSLFDRIVFRKGNCNDKQLLEILTCSGRDVNWNVKAQLKEEKRGFLKSIGVILQRTYHPCGILISERYPYICATPDGIGDDHIIEIKVPKSPEEFRKYINEENFIDCKYLVQIQIQMYVAKVKKAIFCVVSPDFEATKRMYQQYINLDMVIVERLLEVAKDFWEGVVFPHLKAIYLQNE